MLRTFDIISDLNPTLARTETNCCAWKLGSRNNVGVQVVNFF